jgi:hypothetical protein
VKFLKKLLPWSLRHQLFALLSLYRRQWRSMRTGMSISPKGEPQPWYTFPAIDYLAGLDFSRKRVFEYGSGNSSIWWSQRCLELTAIENDRKFFDWMNSRGKLKARYVCDEVMRHYVERLNSPQDVIIIDGADREECAKRALGFLAPGGMVILDNSDTQTLARDVLNAANLLRVDFWGWVCVTGEVQCTSIYFDRRPEQKAAKLRKRPKDTAS